MAIPKTQQSITNTQSSPVRARRATQPPPETRGLPALLPLLLLLGFAPAWAATTHYVNPDGVCGGNTPCYTTIQAAINAASSGDTIQVAAGTYIENVQINKPLVLLGANAGVDPRVNCRLGPARGAEAIIDGGGLDATVAIVFTSDVTVDGFTIRGGAYGGSSGYNGGVYLHSVAAGVHVLNNIITDNTIGVGVECGGACSIRTNWITANNNPTGPGAGAGVYFYSGDTDLTLSDNEISDHTVNSTIQLDWNAPGANHMGLVVTRNNLHDNAYGIYALGIFGGTITGNQITAPAATCLSLAGGNVRVQVANNFFSSANRGIRVNDPYGVGANSAIQIQGNSFVGFTFVAGTMYAVGNLGGYTGTLDASANWWGVNTPTGVPGVIDTSGGPVDYTPWLDTGVEPVAQVCDGFQGDFSSLHVDDSSPQVGSLGPIQEGINLIADGALTGGSRLLAVEPGVYSAYSGYYPVLINKPLTMLGTGGAANTTLSGKAMYMVAIDSSDVTMDGFTVTEPTYTTGGWDGDGSGIYVDPYGAPTPLSNVHIKNCVVHDIGQRPLGMFIGCGHGVEVDHCTVFNLAGYAEAGYGVRGIYLWDYTADGSATASIHDNIIYAIGPNAVNGANGIDIGGGFATASIYQNQVTLPPTADRCIRLRSSLDATITIGNDDCDENPFTFAIQGVGLGDTPLLAAETATVVADDCNGDGLVDPNEIVTVLLAIRNLGNAPTANLVGTLLPSGGVTSPGGPQVYGAIPPGGAVAMPFSFQAANLACGSALTATLQLQDGPADLGTVSYGFPLGGVGASTGPIAVPIPDLGTADIPLTVTTPLTIGDVNVRFRLNHTFDGDLVISLIHPDATEVLLVNRRGGSGDNFGTGLNDCSGTPTVMDDQAAAPVSAGVAPFAGSFRPEAPLSAFAGKPANGTWILRVSDQASEDVGVVGCFSLELLLGACCGPRIAASTPVTLTAENAVPANQAADPCETVTVLLPLINLGTADTVNLVATLLPTGGVTIPSGPQTYGALVAGGPAVARPFTFTAQGACGDPLILTLALQDGARSLGTVSFDLRLGAPVPNTFANTTPITIPAGAPGASSGAATPYPSTITVSGIAGPIETVTVRLKQFSHTFPDDVDVLLVSPAGQAFVLMSDAGGGTDAVGVDLTFDDAAAGAAPDTGGIPAGTYRPADYGTGDAFPAPAPGTYLSPAPVGAATLTSAFAGQNANGTWSLYVHDDANGDVGTLAGGWEITITPTADCSVPGATFATDWLPPAGQYVSSNELATAFPPTSVVIKNICHGPLVPIAPPPPLLGNGMPYTFTANVRLDLSLNGGNSYQTVMAPALTTVFVQHTHDAGGVSYFDTEMVQLDLGGGMLPSGVLVRESPTFPSLGETRIEPLGGGGYQISSFFDVFTEFSYDIGTTWIPADGPIHMRLVRAVNVDLVCPRDVTVECGPGATLPEVTGYAVATSPCGVVAPPTYSDVISGSCPWILQRTWTAVDMCGNPTDCVQTITIEDTTPPQIACLGDTTIECPAAPSFADPTPTDLCGTVSLSHRDETLPGDCGTPGGQIKYATKRTWVATDECGHTATCSQTITVRDTTAPSLTAPAGKDVEGCDEGAIPGLAYSETPVAITLAQLVAEGGSASDACGLSLSYVDSKAGSCPVVVTRTFRAVDPCLNETVKTQTINVDDTTPPQFTCALGKTVECAVTAWTFDPPLAASDNCGSVTVNVAATVTNMGPGNTFRATRTWQAADACGNITTCSQTVTVADTTPPTLTCAPAKTTACGAPWAFDPPVGFELCSSVYTIVLSTVTNPGPGTAYTVTRTWRAADGAGNTAACSQSVTVGDSAAATLLCVPDKRVECGAAWDFDEPTASEGCVSLTPVLVGTVTSATCGGAFTATRTWQVTAADSSVLTCSQTVTVEDTTAPTVTCVPAKTVECGESWSFDEPAASDTCGGVTVGVLGTETIPGCGLSLTATRTWVVSDGCGHTATCSQTVTVEDTTPPTLSCAPGKSVECGTAWAFDEPAASDTCGGVTVSVLGTVTVPGCGLTMTATRTWVAADACGHTATCSQTVTVEDTTPPTLSCAPGKSVECGAGWSFDPPVGASDGCGAVSVGVLSTVTNAGCGLTYTATRTWRAVDDCGRAATCAQTVSVVDTTAPTLSCGPGRTVECGEAWSFDTPTGFESCGNVSVGVVGTVTHATCGGAYVATRTWRASDACGNTAECSQTVTVVDGQAPVLTCAPDQTMQSGDAWTCTPPSVSDNCDPALGVVVVGTVINAGPGGTWSATRTWRATDACGNASQCSQTVWVGTPFGRVSGRVQLQGLVGTGTLPTPHTRVFTFVATTNHVSGTNVLKTWTLSLSNGGGDTFDYELADVPPEANGLSVKTAWNQRRKLGFAFDAGLGAVVDYVGADQLRAGDMTGDNVVNLPDYSLLITYWLPPWNDVSVTPGAAAADLDGSGFVNVLDYELLGGAWFTTGDPE